MAGAVALLGTAGLTSCNGKNGPEGPNRYNGETVKTEFSITIPEVAGGSNGDVKRMPSTTVQRDGASQFQGITGIQLVPFATQVITAPATTPIQLGDARLGNAPISLTGDVAASDINKPSHAKVYTNVSIPLTTASFLLYGKSAASGTKFEVGSLSSHIDEANLANYHFDLEPIQSDMADITGTGTNGKKLLTYLTSIANAEDHDGVKWSTMTDAQGAGLKAMFDTYASMHGLSSFEVERVLTDLNKSLKPLDNGSDATPNLPRAIRKKIADANYATVNASDEVVLNADLDDFPGELDLPVGSIDIKWQTDAFVDGTYSNMAHPTTYVYPAQLWYFVNSLIKTSNTSKQTMYDNTNDWNAITAAHTDAAAVNTKTRAVAITSPIQYAVARLDLRAKISSGSLADNSDNATGIATPVSCGAGFPISAILVGGQRQVGWDFTTLDGDEFTIYDKALGNLMNANNGSYSSYNYTLVLETDGDDDVQIAVEMTNNTGQDFYGHNNEIIPAGGKFYVVAKLTSAAATSETDGHVFKQDYITKADLTLKSLRNAYNTIPDLRTPKLELGFSVDLTWQEGHTYEIDFQ